MTRLAIKKPMSLKSWKQSIQGCLKTVLSFAFNENTQVLSKEAKEMWKKKTTQNAFNY